MKTKLTARNLELSDRLRTQIERKLQRLDRLDPNAEASVELIARASHATHESHVAEVTLVSSRAVLRSTASGATPLAAFDTVLDKVERQVVRSRQRPRSVRERAADEVDAVLARAAAGTADDDDGRSRHPSVVKLKRFGMEPMFEEDAIARMDELGHAFFVFLNAESDSVAVVYRRRDGDYGLIEPVLDRRERRA